MSDGHIDPSRASVDAFKALPRDEPIHMLNLLRFRERAEYPQGHEHGGKGWSGRRAYREYGIASGPVFGRLGGSIVWSGSFDATVIGPEDERWDIGFVARYRSGAAFLADSRLVRFVPGDPRPALG